MDKPKVAWIDHSLFSAPFRDRLIYSGGIDIYHGSSLERVEQKCDLSSFKVILCHIGREYQEGVLKKINKKYPNLKIGIMTNINESFDYSDAPVFGFGNPNNFYEKVSKFVRENQ
jgi:hypothetical protein